MIILWNLRPNSGYQKDYRNKEFYSKPVVSCQDVGDSQRNGFSEILFCNLVISQEKYPSRLELLASVFLIIGWKFSKMVINQEERPNGTNPFKIF